MEYEEVMEKLESLKDPEAVKGMARFGINPENNLGISVSKLRKIGKEIGRDHDLAKKLWSSGVHDARILSCIIDDPGKLTEEEIEVRVRDLDSWDLCDTCCGSLFDNTVFAFRKAVEWSARDKEFVKRAGFALMAWLAVHDKKTGDKEFDVFFPVIMREAGDERNYVKKAVNWALRQIGKRNFVLNEKAIEVAREIEKMDSKAARWIAKDAIRELTGEKVKERLEKREKRMQRKKQGMEEK